MSVRKLRHRLQVLPEALTLGHVGDADSHCVVIYGVGQVVDLHSAALTNDPAVKGMAEAAALTNQPQSKQTKPTEPKPMKCSPCPRG